MISRFKFQNFQKYIKNRSHMMQKNASNLVVKTIWENHRTPSRKIIDFMDLLFFKEIMGKKLNACTSSMQKHQAWAFGQNRFLKNRNRSVLFMTRNRGTSVSVPFGLFPVIIDETVLPRCTKKQLIEQQILITFRLIFHAINTRQDIIIMVLLNSTENKQQSQKIH